MATTAPYLLKTGGTPVLGGSHPNSFLCRQPKQQIGHPGNTYNAGEFAPEFKSVPGETMAEMFDMWRHVGVRLDLAQSSVLIPGDHLIHLQQRSYKAVSYSFHAMYPLETAGDINSPNKVFNFASSPLSINITAFAEMTQRIWTLLIIKPKGAPCINPGFEQGLTLVDGNYIVVAIADKMTRVQMCKPTPGVPHKPGTDFHDVLYQSPGWAPKWCRSGGYPGGPALSQVPKTADGVQLDRGGWKDLSQGIQTPRRFTTIIGADPDGVSDRIRVVEIAGPASSLPDFSAGSEQHELFNARLTDVHGNIVRIPDDIRSGCEIMFASVSYDEAKQTPFVSPNTLLWTDGCCSPTTDFNL